MSLTEIMISDTWTGTEQRDKRLSRLASKVPTTYPDSAPPGEPRSSGSRLAAFGVGLMLHTPPGTAEKTLP